MKILSLSCTPVQGINRLGGPILIRIVLTNLSDAEVEIPAVGIPWQAFYAIEFKVKNIRGFRRRLAEGVPRTSPPTRIPPGSSISGQVDLGEYLLTPTGDSIAHRPGEYVIEAKVKTFLPKRASGHKLVQLRSTAFTVTIVER